MRLTLPKIAALIVAVSYVVVCVRDPERSGMRPEDLRYFLVLLFPLALIWFPEVIGSATGFIGHGAIDYETPPWLVSAAGWFFLVGLPALLWRMS